MSMKTINLSGSEVAISKMHGTNVAIRNDSTQVVYVSYKPNIVAGEEGVLSIPAGQSAVMYGNTGDNIYAIGNGSLMLVSSDYNENPFNSSALTGDSGADEVARAAIALHNTNNEIHVTDDERSIWNSKAELSDIPLALPADGGNADSVDGKHSTDLFRCIDYSSKSYYSLNDLLETGLYWNTWWTDYPSMYNDGQGMVFVINYKGKNNENIGGTIGEYEMWLRQIYFSAHGGKIMTRTVMGRNVSEWKDIASDGNAAALQSYNAADFVLRSEYDELLTKVTSLETAVQTFIN